MRRNVALAVVALFGTLGFWLGEGGSPPWAALPVGGGVFGCLAVALIVPGKPWCKALGGVAFLALYAIAFFFGSLSFSRAFNECVDRGEEVRVQLSDYYQEENQYPERLSQLEGRILCERIIRDTVLEYERAKGGYVLSFKDSLLEHTATESLPFMAQK